MITQPDHQAVQVVNLLDDAAALADANPGMGWWTAIAQAAPLSWASWCASSLAKDQATPGRTPAEVLRAAAYATAIQNPAGGSMALTKALWQNMDNKWWGIWGECKQAQAKALDIARASNAAAAVTNIPEFSAASTQARELVKELIQVNRRIEELKATLDLIEGQVGI